MRSCKSVASNTTMEVRSSMFLITNWMCYLFSYFKSMFEVILVIKCLKCIGTRVEWRLCWREWEWWWQYVQIIWWCVVLSKKFWSICWWRVAMPAKILTSVRIYLTEGLDTKFRKVKGPGLGNLLFRDLSNKNGIVQGRFNIFSQMKSL